MENHSPNSITTEKKLTTCDTFKHSLSGDIGDIVTTHEKLIVHYYEDVQLRASESFDSAKRVARIGFFVLIATLVYTLVFDALSHIKAISTYMINPQNSLTVGGIGVVSGLLIEFIAGVQFWLYSKTMRQFSAFHICLERTHRYLIAYKIAEKIETNKDETLQKLVCIMANAPMITAQETGSQADATLFEGVAQRTSQ